jgi:hypothetical protein
MLEDQKAKKSSRRSSRRRKNRKANKSTNSGKPSKKSSKLKQNEQEKLKLKKLPLDQIPLTDSMQALPLR